MGNNGIILNPDKFVLGKDVIDWAGVRLLKDKAEPLPDHVKAIREFPTPKNLTDMRSYFALVNQVAPYYAVQPHLQPFRELLKKGSRWYWDNCLQELFQESRIVIAEEILMG